MWSCTAGVNVTRPSMPFVALIRYFATRFVSRPSSISHASPLSTRLHNEPVVALVGDNVPFDEMLLHREQPTVANASRSSTTSHFTIDTISYVWVFTSAFRSKLPRHALSMSVTPHTSITALDLRLFFTARFSSRPFSVLPAYARFLTRQLVPIVTLVGYLIAFCERSLCVTDCSMRNASGPRASGSLTMVPVPLIAMSTLTP